MIDIHSSASISPLADIEDSTRGTKIVFAKGVIVDAFVKVKPAGGTGDLYIGEDSVINSGCVLYTGNGIKIGVQVSIASNCTFAPTNHAYSNAAISIREQGFLPSKGGITIGDDVWIGANSVLLDGVNIGNGCVIAACSLVRESLEAYGVYGGNPLRKIGKRS